MSANYLKVGKIYTINQSNATSAFNIPSASFIHQIHNLHSGGAITITIDESYSFLIAASSYLNFNVPVAFSSIKIDTAASHAANVIYS